MMRIVWLERFIMREEYDDQTIFLVIDACFELACGNVTVSTLDNFGKILGIVCVTGRSKHNYVNGIRNVARF
jgi:hypothetical protein